MATDQPSFVWSTGEGALSTVQLQTCIEQVEAAYASGALHRAPLRHCPICGALPRRSLGPDSAWIAHGTTFPVTEGTRFLGVVACVSGSGSVQSRRRLAASGCWGDHTTSRGLLVAMGSGHWHVYGGHLYPDAGTYVVRVTILTPGRAELTATSFAEVAEVSVPVGDGAMTRLMPQGDVLRARPGNKDRSL